MNKNIIKAVKILKKGGLIAFPTETVYGLGANAECNTAVKKIFVIKKRPFFNPLICHFYDIDSVKKQTIFNSQAKLLSENFWPGPLTIILRRRKNSTISKIATSELDTIACRIPSNRIAKKILKLFKGIIAAPSANISSKLTSTSKKHVRKNFGQGILTIEGGNTKFGIESTVIDLTSKNPKLLRPGAINFDVLKAILPKLSIIKNKKKISSPGQLSKHYSPEIPLRLNIKKVKKGEVLLNFGKNNLRSKIKELNLSKRGNLDEAAKNLFKFLHILNKKKYLGIAVAPIKNKDIGIAINDRLKRASFNE